MIVRPAGFTLAFVEMDDAVAWQLIDRNDESSAVAGAIDGEAFAVLAIAACSEQRNFAIRAGRGRIGVPFVDARDLVRVIHVPQFIVYGHGLNLARAAEIAEAAYRRSAHAAGTVIGQAELRQIVLRWSRFRRDDREDGAIARAAIQRHSHW